MHASSLRGLELLIDVTHALERHIRTKQSIDKCEKRTGGHLVSSDLIAGVEEKKRDDNGAEQVHDRRGDDGSAHPAHVIAEQLAGSVAKFTDFEIFHSESFDDAISTDCFLEYLAQVGKTGLAVFRGTADLATKFADGNDDKREEHGRGERHFPVKPKEHADENDETEARF